jgi:hypothetical protein
VRNDITRFEPGVRPCETPWTMWPPFASNATNYLAG